MSKLQQGCTNAIILDEQGRILLTERSIDDDFFPGYWELPGGGIEYGETPQQSVKREIREECGIDIEVIKPIAANTYFLGELQRIEITFLCKSIDPRKVKLSPEHSNYKWLGVKDIGGIKVSYYVKNILNSSSQYLE